MFFDLMYAIGGTALVDFANSIIAPIFNQVCGDCPILISLFEILFS